jgi:hypothetical protein
MPTALAKPLAQRAGGGLDPQMHFALRVTGGLGAELAEILDLLHGQGIAGQVQHRIQQHGRVAVRQHEAVAVDQVGFPGLNLSTSRHSTSAMSAIPIGAPGVAGIGLLDGIHRQSTNGIGKSRRVGMENFFIGERPGIVPDATPPATQGARANRLTKWERGRTCACHTLCITRERRP